MESDIERVMAPRWWSVSLLALALGVFTGAIFVVNSAFGLRRFGGLEYVPRIVALAATRVLAGGPAALAVVLLGVRALHHAASKERPERPRLSAAWPFVATLASTIPSYVGLLMGAIAASAAYGISAALYADAARTTLNLTDPLVGIAYACLNAALATGVIYVGRRAWLSSKWALAGKWIVAFVVLRIVAAVLSRLASFVGA